MIADTALAPSAVIHGHLVGRLNDVLRRPGMYVSHGNGEFTVMVLIDLILLAEQRPGLLDEQQDRWREQGAFLPTGVTGAFSFELPAAHDLGAMSVYAGFARRAGWLRTDRLLDDEEYRGLRGRIAEWTAQDRTLPDVLAAFGPPSLLIGGTNPRWPNALCYVPVAATEPMVTFHLWNEWDSGLAQPVLLAVDAGGDGPFAERFAFTPEGLRRRP